MLTGSGFHSNLSFDQFLKFFLKLFPLIKLFLFDFFPFTFTDFQVRSFVIGVIIICWLSHLLKKSHFLKRYGKGVIIFIFFTIITIVIFLKLTDFFTFILRIIIIINLFLQADGVYGLLGNIILLLLQLFLLLLLWWLLSRYFSIAIFVVFTHTNLLILLFLAFLFVAVIIIFFLHLFLFFLYMLIYSGNFRFLFLFLFLSLTCFFLISALYNFIVINIIIDMFYTLLLLLLLLLLFFIVALFIVFTILIF